MDKKEFEKRLSKCSKESIAIYLLQFGNQHALREIEAIEYDVKSKRLIEQMEKANRLSKPIRDTIENRYKYFEYHQQWEKANKELDRLHKWFASTLESEGR